MANFMWTNQRPGYTWNQQSGWINPTKAARGTVLGQGVALPVEYDPTKDTYHSGVNGTTESAMQRAMRWAQDMVNTGKTQNYQNALAFAMANLSSDWTRGQRGQQPDWNPGTSLGWDASQFRYNDLGEQYNDQIDYSHPTRWMDNTGKVLTDPARMSVDVASPGAGGKRVVKTIKNPDGSMTATYDDGSTRTAYLDGHESVTGPTAGGTSGTNPPAPTSVKNAYGQDVNYGGTNAAQKIALQDPDLALAVGFRNQGYDINAPGVLSNFVQGRFRDLLDARIAAAGADGSADYLDTIDNLVNDFAHGALHNGEDFFAQQRAAGQKALSGGADYLNQLQDQTKAQQFARQMLTLTTAGRNDMVRQALGDLYSRQTLGYGLDEYDLLGQNKNIDPFMRWLANSPYARYFLS